MFSKWDNPRLSPAVLTLGHKLKRTKTFSADVVIPHSLLELKPSCRVAVTGSRLASDRKRSNPVGSLCSFSCVQWFHRDTRTARANDFLRRLPFLISFFLVLGRCLPLLELSSCTDVKLRFQGGPQSCLVEPMSQALSGQELDLFWCVQTGLEIWDPCALSIMRNTHCCLPLSFTSELFGSAMKLWNHHGMVKRQIFNTHLNGPLIFIHEWCIISWQSAPAQVDIVWKVWRK